MKPSWKSKTVWLNAVCLATATCGFLTTQDIIKDHPVAVAVLVVVQSVGNLVLRFNSYTPIKLK